MDERQIVNALMESVTVEQASDRTWTASVDREHILRASGDTRETAIQGLRRGIEGVLEHLAMQEHLSRSPLGSEPQHRSLNGVRAFIRRWLRVNGTAHSNKTPQ